ncbi:MAG TPA: HD domain-containing protein [Rectinemataceae bacterium]|nr:HD domain-containing protein [Rectinemataceae bacterium]
MDSILAPLAERGLCFWETSFSALDAYFGLDRAPVRFVALKADLVELAKSIGALEFRSLSWADASAEAGGLTVHFRCVDEAFRSDEGMVSFAPLDLFREPDSRRFFDPRGVYEGLRKGELEPRGKEGAQLFEAAVLVSRYEYRLPEAYLPAAPRELPAHAQRDLLSLILTSAHPERGLELLRKSGFIAAFWPELAALPGTSQSKEYHPEGDAWDHTLETFRYRKLADLPLSLALLLHDTGKPDAAAADGKRFARHSEIGAGLALRFLSRLGFDRETADTVGYLVRWHMLPAALPRLPIQAAREAIEDWRFPLLLELYRCDELSTFRGPEGYYEACAAYREYRRHLRNPFRDEEGRKLMRLYVEGAPPYVAAQAAAGRAAAGRKGSSRPGSARVASGSARARSGGRR